MTIEVCSYGVAVAGPAVVVLHGGPGAPGSVTDLAHTLGHSFLVLEPLQRRSGAIHLSVSQHVEDLAEIAPKQSVLVGWSWGAMLGLSFAARYPDRVGALALVGCGTYGEADRANYRQAMDQRLGHEGRQRMSTLAREIEKATDSVERDHLLTEMGHLATKAQSVDLIQDDKNMLPADARGYHETWHDVLRLQREGIEPAAFEAICSPVLMLHGADDPHPGPTIMDTLKRSIPHLLYVGFLRCGHLPWRERYAREPFLRTLEDWLRSQTTGRKEHGHQ